MTSFLSSLSSRLAERWVGLIVVPGLMFVVSIACGFFLGHGHAWSVGLLDARISEYALQHDRGASVAITAVEVLLVAIGAGALARLAGRLVELVWFGRWSGPAAPLARRLTQLRRTRADTIASIKKINPVTNYLPQRPTWIGDQLRLPDQRIAAQYRGLQLALVWPRLWLLFPESVRAPIHTASNNFHDSANLTGWGVLYILLGAIWYPAALAGMVSIVAGWYYGRVCTVAFTTLVESAVDTHLALLTTAMNMALPEQGITDEHAARINDRLRKGA